jgi:hypothetical protein
MKPSYGHFYVYYAALMLALCILNPTALAEKSLNVNIDHSKPNKNKVANADFDQLPYKVSVKTTIDSVADLDSLNYKIDFVIRHKNIKAFDDSISRIIDLVLSEKGNNNTGTSTKGISPWSISSTARSSKTTKNGEFIVSIYALIGHGDVGDPSLDPAVKERIDKGKDGVIDTSNGKILIINVGNVVVTIL